MRRHKVRGDRLAWLHVNAVLGQQQHPRCAVLRGHHHIWQARGHSASVLNITFGQPRQIDYLTCLICKRFNMAVSAVFLVYPIQE